jgi:hypothetical protein
MIIRWCMGVAGFWGGILIWRPECVESQATALSEATWSGVRVRAPAPQFSSR